jgi:hypothetical protein
VHIVNNGTPTGGYAQIATLGGNDSVNAAILQDFGDAGGSRIIRGDYHETNAIAQINVLRDNDMIEIHGAKFVETLVGGDNTTVNDAGFLEQPTGSGSPPSGGFPGALHWHVDYVNGDVYDISSVIQRNGVSDNDLGEQTATNTHFTATLGENDQISVTQLLEFGNGYDLLIVGGDYFKFNAIVQYNVVLDDDILDQLMAGSGSGTQSANAGGNALLNDAAIVNIGNSVFQPLLDGPPVELADAIENQVPEFDYALTIGLPGNGTGALEILYVTGNYYNYNFTLQTNIVADVDVSSQSAAGIDTDRLSDPEALSQISETGGNTAANLALIVNVDSTSDYQFLGGQYYEDTVLVQANLVTNEDTVKGDHNLDSGLLATLAAISEAGDTGGHDDSSGPGSGLEILSSDVMGGVLH